MIDLVSILPWDRETVLNSVKKTGRCIVSHEAPYTGGFGAEIAASIQVKKKCLWSAVCPSGPSMDGRARLDGRLWKIARLKLVFL